MSDRTGIQWTDASWPIVNGCTRVSPGCQNCYAERLIATRLRSQPKYAGLAEMRDGKPRWTHEVRLWEKHLDMPLRWRRPRRIFVANMGDLFHDSVPDEFIDRVFAVMSLCPQHVFQVLTKRPQRMQEYLTSEARWAHVEVAARRIYFDRTGKRISGKILVGPLGNTWLGVSCEDQSTADERIPLLLQTPAAVRFISAEPLLGPIDLTGWGDHAPTAPSEVPETWTGYTWPEWVPKWQRQQIEEFWSPSSGRGPLDWLRDHEVQRVPATGAYVTVKIDEHGWANINKMASAGVHGRYLHSWNNVGRLITDDGQCFPASGGIGSGWLCKWRDTSHGYRGLLDLVIVGGESGPGARPCDVAWIRSVVRQCREAGVACFTKQLGAYVVDRNDRIAYCPEDPQTWPDELDTCTVEHHIRGYREDYQGAPVRLLLRDRKGGDPSEWPEDLRCRELPQ